MEEKAPSRSAMVSRLPKFGGRSPAGGTNPLPNGSTQPTTPTQDNKTAHSGTRPNGVIRTSPFSLKWRRDYGTSSSGPTTPTSPGEEGEDEAQPQLPSLTKEVKNGPPGTPKIRRAGTLTVAVSSPKAIPKQSLKLSPKVGTKLNGEPKITQNGCSVPARTGSESRLTRPRLGCSSPRSISQDSLSQSSDSLKTLALDNMVRSNSFTHFKQIPSPTNQPMTRSFSFNRAVELAKPLTNTQLRPPRSSFLKPPQLSNGKVSLGLGGLSGSLGGSGGQSLLHYSRTPPAASSLPMPLITSAPSTPSALKKPLLPSSVLTKPLGSIGGSLGFRMARSKQANQQKPLFPDRPKDDVGSTAATECGSLLGLALDIDSSGETENVEVQSDSDGSSRDGGGSVLLTQSLGHAAGETLEDMSLSSVSSLDRGDTSEELLDDLDSLGDVLSDGEMPDNRTTGSTTQTHQNSCPNAPRDWNAVDVAEDKEESPMQDSQGPLVMSPQHGGAPLASSVELSPSNSSGGTYMWDEEGFEPLPGPGTHLLDSFDDSELNSMDILNNLDPLGSGELDDDDLMLDVDLPEDGVHDADGMSCTERSERAGRPGQRRRHPRWAGPSCRGSRAQFSQHHGDVKAPRMPLDEVTLQHMTQDCSSLRNQLLRLKALLKLEDTDSPADVPEEAEDGAAASRLQELIKEVQALRGELRSRDRTIAQLTLQCQQLREQQHQQQVRCQCHQQRAPSSLGRSDRQADRRLQHQCDKATQTCGRAANHAAVLLHPSLSPWQAQHQGVARATAPQRTLMDVPCCLSSPHTFCRWQGVEQLVRYFTDTACLKYYSLSTPASASTPTWEG
ncbi:serine-rich coiled-coil domain-containing protein 2 isoform X3 [Betta splendens]|uniref:Serine-rich coiled-coil domain-containing protein 2 isoform X3 n=1 Tax=Betta splendens TaxID=158456 RepID=A0A6P7KJX2_BETSP|nr:serine-rich coiled-coil domain-containing protein 2 isoform X3 [Betta splendens]